MEENIVKNKKVKVLGVLLAIAIIIIFGLVGYICYDKGIIFNKNTVTNESTDSNSSTKKSTEDEAKEDEKEEVTASLNKPKCYGTYYGEARVDSGNGHSYDYKCTYILKEDGTFSFDDGFRGTSGVFVINDNTVSLTGTKETVGPRDKDPYYSTEDFVIADDCSYILYYVTGDNYTFKLNRQ